MMKNKLLRSALIFTLMASMAACSSSPEEEGGEEDVVPAAEGETAEAGTDALPLDEELGDELPPAIDQAATDAPAAPSDDPTLQAATDPAAVDPLAAPPATDTAAMTSPEAAPPASETEQSPVQDFSTPAPAPVASTGSGQFDEYTVQAGDTLMKIAFETYGDLYRWRDIYEANRDRVSSPNGIPTGTVLKVERPSESISITRNGEKYLIKDGDTLGTISEDVYGTKKKWKKLWENNRELIKDPNRIFAGFHLYYTIDEEDRRELAPKPLAENNLAPAQDTNRMPASEAPAASQATTQVAPTMPTMAAPVAPAPEPVSAAAPNAVNGG